MKGTTHVMLVFSLLVTIQARAKIVDRIVAQVNDDIITLSDLNRRLSRDQAELQSQYSGEELEAQIKQAEKNVLEDLIQEKLLLQRANDYGFAASVDPQVSAAIQRIIKDNNFRGTADLEKALQQQGMNLLAFREDIRKNIIIQSLIREFVGSRITVLSEEIERYYKDHARDFATPAELSLSEIIIRIDRSESAARSRANDIHKRLSEGEAFATLASQYSKGATANKGGNIGKYELANLNAELAAVVENVKEGEVTPVLKTQEGIVIYRVDSRKDASVAPIESVRVNIQQILWDQKYNPELKRFVTGIREEAYIQIFNETKEGAN